MLLLSIEHAQTIRTSKAQKNARTKSPVESMRVKKLIDARGLALPFIGIKKAEEHRGEDGQSQRRE